MKKNINNIIATDLKNLEESLSKSISSEISLATEVSTYLVNSGGKRIRPIICILTAKALGYKGNKLIQLASSIELLHTATLIHDDVVDESSSRRGKESIHKKWDNAHGVLVGDFVYSKAFQLMAGLRNPKIIKILADSTNIISEGEVLQLSLKNKAIISEKDYFGIIGRKTAELFKAASQSAAVLSGVSNEVVKTAGDFAYSLGIAFQIQDDLLDYFGNKELTGKKIGKDFEEGKITLPLLRTIELTSNQNKKNILKLISKKDSSSLSKVIEIIKGSGALKEVQEICNSYIEDCLSKVSLFPDSIYKIKIQNIVKEVRERKG
jgi:octaprenyl-diphosphate synthase